MRTVHLNENWNMTVGSHSFEVNLPMLNLHALIDAKILPTLNEAKSDREYFDYSDKECTFRKTFICGKDITESEFATLYFERLDTVCTVSVNGKVIAKPRNIHLTRSFPVKEHLTEGENTVEVVFHSLRDYIARKQEKLKLPPNFNGTTGHPHIRKCGCHFGWDFGPELNAQGIGGKCELRYGNKAGIEFLSVGSSLKDGKGTVSLSCEMTEGKKEKVVYTLYSPEGEIIESKESTKKNFPCTFETENPALWWCNGLGEQPLYRISAEHIVDGTSADKKEKKIGFRTITLDKSKDKYGSNFQFIINGKPIFAKGGNYIPLDALYTMTTPEKLRELLTECKKANMNMIRVWGGGFYESDLFYDICDELGILLWQDCAFACCAYPFMQEKFLQNVKEEIVQNVKRLRHRACLALWCGNNEIESMSMAWIARKDIIDSTGKFFYEMLPVIIKEYDSVTPYHPCSPSSEKYMKVPNSDKTGDTHIWNVWHGYQYKEYFTKRFTRFCSEFGMQSYPDESLTPHQKCDMGEERLNYYLSGIFTVPKDARSKVYLTQIIQSETMKRATEHFRIHSHRCHGALFWQLNDCWPSASWAGFDCENGKKALIYAAKKFNAPLLVTAERKGSKIGLYLCNDTLNEFGGKAEVKVIDTFSGKENTKIYLCSCSPLSSKKFGELPVTQVKDKVLCLKLYDKSGAFIGENRLTFTNENKLKLQDPNLKITFSEKEGIVFAKISAENYARFVYVRTGRAKLSDNFFDLSKGEEKEIEIYGITKEEAEKKAEILSLYEILFGRNKAKDISAHIKEFARPMALANRISRYFDK